MDRLKLPGRKSRARGGLGAAFGIIRNVRLPRRALLALAAVLAALVLVAAAAILLSAARDAEGRDLAAAGAAAFSKGHFADASSALRRAAAIRPGDAHVQELLGRSLEARGDLAGARLAYAASLKVSPGQPEVLYRAALIARASGKRAEAAVDLGRAVAADQGFVAGHLLLARTYAELGQKARARVQYDIVIGLAPLGMDLRSLRNARDSL